MLVLQKEQSNNSQRKVLTKNLNQFNYKSLEI